MPHPGLHAYLEASAARRGTHPAVEETDGSAISYSDLDALSDALRNRLQAMGVMPGDRVGVYLHKSIDAVATIFAILKCGAAYVPVDPGAPPARNAYIFDNCGVSAAVIEAGFEAGLRAELAHGSEPPAFVVVPRAGGGHGLRASLEAQRAISTAPPGRSVEPVADDLAYILYTSGSTGRPKGVMLSHRNASSFIDWCSAEFTPRPEDRFSAHAPFHFDLSILDIFLSIKHGATLVVIDAAIGKDPEELARVIAASRISIWYSAPSMLSLLAQRGKLEQHDYRHLRTVLFAGEVFPVVHLRALTKLWPGRAYHNLYGPTETNVCTAYRIPDVIPDDRVEPYPIGKVCTHLDGIVVDASGEPLAASVEGELCIAGAAVMHGYWNDSAQTEQRFVAAAGRRWYRTGDIVRLDANGDYVYMGRRDRMVKKRGYRVELDEIEACLYRHPEVLEAAVVALPHEELGLLVRAHLGTRDGQRISVVKLKSFCSQYLPTYMIPDRFEFHAVLPKTSTGKTDYQALATVR